MSPVTTIAAFRNSTSSAGSHTVSGSAAWVVEYVVGDLRNTPNDFPQRVRLAWKVTSL